MNERTWVRRTHRWTSVAFSATVVLCVVALSGVLPVWVFYLPLLPLVLLMGTGLYLFARPYATRWRNGRRTTVEP